MVKTISVTKKKRLLQLVGLIAILFLAVPSHAQAAGIGDTINGITKPLEPKNLVNDLLNQTKKTLTDVTKTANKTVNQQLQQTLNQVDQTIDQVGSAARSLPNPGTILRPPSTNRPTTNKDPKPSLSSEQATPPAVNPNNVQQVLRQSPPAQQVNESVARAKHRDTAAKSKQKIPLAAKVAAFPILLFILDYVYLGVQSLLDRKEPKLAAPSQEKKLWFS